MAKPEDADLTAVLAPLVDALSGQRTTRLVARPGAVRLERWDGQGAVAVPWEREQHEQALRALTAAMRLANGVVASAHGDCVVLERPPDPLRRIDDVVADGRISSLAGRLLSASVGTGRNVLVLGPRGAGVELCAALLAEGSAAAVLGRDTDAVPAAWPRFGSVEEVRAVGADRLGVWSASPAELVLAMTRCNGVAAWMDARRLDRALARYELACEQSAPHASSPLAVLAGVDLVVVCGGSPVRVNEVAAIELAEDGYRPRLLFATHRPPVPAALVPVSPPSFIDELAAGGQTVLADELRHAVGAVQSESAAVRPEPPARALRPTPARREEPAGGAEPTPPPPAFDPGLADAPPPGWELDQLGDEALGGAEAATPSTEAASLAASFGLGPPPPPPGVAPLGADAFAGGEAKSFDEALRRARARDEELRQSEPGTQDGEE